MVDFSVICPTYNSSSFIKKTLSSLEAQTYKPYEIIFADDGSSDDTVSILQEFKNRSSLRVDVLKGEHKGPGAARNLAASKASGSWLAFLDSDDTWREDKLEKVAKEIELNPDNNFFLHWEKYIRISGENRILRNGESYNPNMDLITQIYTQNDISTSASVCLKRLFDASGGFDPKLPVSQDYDLWLKCSESMKLKVIPEVLGSYYERAQSITAKPYYFKYPHLIKILFSHRQKVQTRKFLVRLFEITFSKQWLKTLYFTLKGVQRH